MAPIDRVCDLLRDHPQLVASCPDTVWCKFRLGHWAKLIREPNKNSSCHAIASNEGRLAVVDKMKELGVATEVANANEKAVLIGGFKWARFRRQVPPEMAQRLQGYIHTIWSGADHFLNRYYRLKDETPAPGGRPDDARALRSVIEAFKQLQ